MMVLNKNLESYMNDNMQYLYHLTEEICKIPSATGHEHKKALFIQRQLKDMGVENTRIDGAGNLLYAIESINSSKFLVIAAHIDTVFKGIETINPVIKDNRIYAPSVFDNSVNIAALIFIIKMIRELNLKFTKSILFAFDVGEEGIGNLKGMKEIFMDMGEDIEEVIALDGGYDSIVTSAVGSKRYSVRIETSGGHSYNDFGNENAIRCGAEIISELYKIIPPSAPKTTYNVGLISGGTSVNTIACDAEIIFDFRSEEQKDLDDLVEIFKKILDKYRKSNVKIGHALMGERPCGQIGADCSLLEIVTETRKAMKLNMNFCSGSTDANIPLSKGVPAISFGIACGKGVHTTGEYLEVSSLSTGMMHLLSILMQYSSK